MPVSTREKAFGRIFGAILSIVGFVLLYASYTSIDALGDYWTFFFVFGLILVAMGLPILLLRVK
jgi:amino acid transporter